MMTDNQMTADVIDQAEVLIILRYLKIINP
jgi:hypothetical protein